jgi:hypothetical protein
VTWDATTGGHRQLALGLNGSVMLFAGTLGTPFADGSLGLTQTVMRVRQLNAGDYVQVRGWTEQWFPRGGGRRE